MLRIEKVFLQGFKSFCDPTEVAFDEEGITAVVGPNGCGKCVDGLTLVTLADGREVQIRDLVEQALLDSQQVDTLDDGVLTRENPHGIEILSLNPQTLKLEPRPVAGFVRREATPHLLRVRTRSGREVSATPYHPLFTLDRGCLRALKAEELEVGTRIALPRRLPVQGRTTDLRTFDVLRQFTPQDRIFIRSTDELRSWAGEAQDRFGSRTEWMRKAGISVRTFERLRIGKGISTQALAELARISETEPPLNGKIKSSGRGEVLLPERFTPEFARFLGLLIAEGRNTASNQVWFVNTDPAINAEFARLAEQLFGLKVHQRNYKPNATDSLIYSRSLAAVLERVFNFPVASNSANKEVPPQVLNAPTKTKWAFLSGLFEGDAYISARHQPNGTRPMAFIEYTTASAKLAGQVTSLLLQLGVFALVRQHEKFAPNTLGNNRRTYFSVLIYGSDQVRFVAEQLTFIGEKSKRLQILRELPSASNPNLDLVPSATSIVKEAARLAGVSVKANRKGHPKLAAYVEGLCQASRNGLLEVRDQIQTLGASPRLADQQLERLEVLATSDVYWDEIVSIEQVPSSDPWVYDLSIAETHNFVAGNIIVHNSNISDAVNWVIGEQRARALRGAKMEDVIFQGSRNRQPAGLAEVLLTMVVHETFEIRSDNGKQSVETSSEETGDGSGDGSKAAAAESAETLDSETAVKPKARRGIRAEAASRVFQEGERVTVGRRLYRTGESEYEMNGRACRLRDIQDLFAGTGLGGAHYAIIEQGRIGQVLSAKPLDRRALIEEAAGISKFKMRQHAAELKLDAARQNLSRITDIIAEIERQQNSLKRQAARARRYQRLRSEMRELMRAVYVADFRATRAMLSDLESEWGATVERETAAQERIAGLEAAQTQAATEAGGAEHSLNETRTAAAGVDLEAARSRQQHQYLSERLSTLGSRADEFARDRETITGRSGFIEQESARLRAELQSIESEINAVGVALASDENEHRKKLQSDAEAEQNLESARRKLYDATTALERWTQLKRQFDEAVDRSETRRQGLAAEKSRAQSQAEANEQECSAVEAERAQQERRAAEIASESSEVQMRLGAAREERAERSQALNTAHRDLTAVEHRLKSLEELDARRAYFSEAVQLLLSRAGMHSEHAEHLQEPGFRILGTLADFVTVAPEHEATVETALRDELQYVLAPGFDDAFRAIEFLKAENAGRATFMVVGLHGAEGPAPIVSGEWGDAEEGDFPSGEIPSGDNQSQGHPLLRPATAPVLIDLLGLRPEFASVFARALPRLAAARVVDTAADAVEAAVSRDAKDADESTVFVTRAGERVVAGRLVTGGTSAERSGGVLALKREIVELTERVGVLSAGLQAAEIGLGEVDLRIQTLDAHRGALDAEMRGIEKELAVLRTRRQQCERDRERMATHLRVVGQETAQIETDLAEYQGKLAHAASQTEEAERSHAAAEAAVAAAQAEVAELRRASDERSQELSRRRAEFAARTERRRGLQNDLQRLENEAVDLGERLQRTRLATVEAEEQMHSAQAQLSDTAARLADLTAQQEQMNEDLNRKSAELQMVRERLAELDLFVRAAREAQAQAREDRARLELDRVRLTSSLEHLAESCYHELGEQLSAIVERLESASSATSEPSISAAQQHTFVEAAEGDDDEDEAGETDLTFWHVPENFDLAAAKARLEELRAKIDALGPINMMALDELNEVEERFRFLIAQKADIEQAVADTQAAIAEIKRRSRERFSDAFHSINRNFQETFQELFGGGRGEMRLIDENDILESGIEIIAQPPGKRLQNVLLLSGGEKAMAAIALVLAIFKYRPSPFCILDEVDAPLDEVNIARFADKVLEMSRQTQFVIITHSKRTMEAARTLYGVTMEDPGVSKLISVRLT